MPRPGSSRSSGMGHERLKSSVLRNRRKAGTIALKFVCGGRYSYMSEQGKSANTRHSRKRLRLKLPAWSHEPAPARQPAANAALALSPATLVVDEAEYRRLLTDMATNLWRLKQKMLRPGTDEPLEEMRRAYRSFEAAWDTLLSAGVDVQEHTGSPFNSGLLLHVLAFQSTPGLEQETVLETIRPTVYYKQQLIQPGEVIVGTPEVSASSVADLPPSDSSE